MHKEIQFKLTFTISIKKLSTPINQFFSQTIWLVRDKLHMREKQMACRHNEMIAMKNKPDWSHERISE